MLTLTYEYKLEPTTEQIAYIENILDVCRSVWNFSLKHRKDWCKSRKSPINVCSLEHEYIMSVDEPFPNYHRQAKLLTEAKKNGEEVKRPRFLKTLQRKLKLLQRRLRNKQKGSNNRHKLNQKIARLHQSISDTRKDWHFKLAHHLCDGAGMIFVEDIYFVSWQRGMLSKHSADASFGRFVNILEWVCFRQDVYFTKVNKDGTSQTCPNCGAHTGKKTLDVRFHHCYECGYTTTRDVAAAQEVRNRGISALEHSVVENVCGLDATGSIGHDILVGTG
jgi:putative transposase